MCQPICFCFCFVNNPRTVAVQLSAWPGTTIELFAMSMHSCIQSAAKPCWTAGPNLGSKMGRQSDLSLVRLRLVSPIRSMYGSTMPKTMLTLTFGSSFTLRGAAVMPFATPVQAAGVAVVPSASVGGDVDVGGASAAASPPPPPASPPASPPPPDIAAVASGNWPSSFYARARFDPSGANAGGLRPTNRKANSKPNRHTTMIAQPQSMPYRPRLTAG